MHAVKIKVIDNFILICTGTDRLDLITSYLFRELTYSSTIERKGKGFFFLNQPFHSKRKMCHSIVSVNAWEREYLQENQKYSVKGVQIKHLVSSSVLKGYNERF